MKVFSVLGIAIIGLFFFASKQSAELLGSWTPHAAIGFIFAMFCMICYVSSSKA